MPKMPKEKRAQLEALLAADDDAEDDSNLEVWIRSGDKEAALPFRHAAGWLRDNFGLDLGDLGVQDEPAKDDPAPGQDEPGPGSPGDAVRRFGRRVS